MEHEVDAIGDATTSGQATPESAQDEQTSIVDALPDATYVLDTDKRVVTWNRACERLTGVDRTHVVGTDAYAAPFHGTRQPMLADLLDEPGLLAPPPYSNLRRHDGGISAEAFLPSVRDGQGAHVWVEARPVFAADGERTGTIEVVRDVTAHKTAERSVLEAERLYRTLFESAGAATVLLRDDHFIDCNRSAEKMFGTTRDDIIGSRSDRFAPPSVRGKGDKNRVSAALASLGDDTHVFEWMLARNDGSLFLAEVDVMRVALGDTQLVRGIVRDVTEDRRVADALSSREREYRELMVLANSIILRWSREGVVTFLNEFGQRFFGYTEEEIVGRHVLDTIVPPSESTGRDLSELMDEVCADPKSFERNTNENVTRDGQRVWIDWTNRVVLDELGGVKEILSIGSDISDQVYARERMAEYSEHLEVEVKKRTAALAASKERAESADRMKSAFLATMSHELRTPLNSIIGFTGILLQKTPGPLTEEQEKQLTMVHNSSMHLLALIGDVLDISKIEAGQLEITRAEFSVQDSIAHVVESVSPSANKKGLILEVHDDRSVTRLVSDRRRFEQVLLNLLSNAVKFTEEGRIDLHVVSPSPGVFEARVEDTGIGISHEEQQRLFQPFHQVDSRLARRYEGTGLGLSISRHLVRLMGGNIWVRSTLGEGSRFGFRLPVGNTEAL